MKEPGKEEFKELAEIAKIELEEAELKTLQARFAEYLRWLEPLLEVDCAACEPLLFGQETRNVLREDRAELSDLKNLGSCAANFEDGYYLVPPIIE